MRLWASVHNVVGPFRSHGEPQPGKSEAPAVEPTPEAVKPAA